MKIKFITLSMILMTFITCVTFYLYSEYTKQKVISAQKLEEKKLLNSIKSKYAEEIVTNTDANLYIKDKDAFINKGRVSKSINLTLDEINNITTNDKYFKIKDIPYYIYYDNVGTAKEKVNYDNSYKNYIVFNEDIITNNPFSLYDENNNIIFKLYEELSLHIIIKDVGKYFVEYNNRLLYIKKEDVKSIVSANNTDASYTNAIAVLNYHFFYDDTLGESCNQVICLKSSKLEEQLKYLSDNNYYAVKMKDLELFIDGKIRLPKNSVSITIDDGGMGVSSKAIPLLEKYKINATLFLIMVGLDKNSFKSPYLEIHSHGNNIHTKNCNGEATIKCLEHDQLLRDLKSSRDYLNQTPYFCYPFYQYNDYAISVLKEAGFRMAFSGGGRKIKQGLNKFTLPRYEIYSYITLNDFIKMIR